jgi:hypothetical protein
MGTPEYSSSATDWESDTLPQSTSHSTLPQANRDDSRLTSQFATNVSQRKLDSERVSSGGFEIASQCGSWVEEEPPGRLAVASEKRGMGKRRSDVMIDGLCRSALSGIYWPIQVYAD